MFDCKCGIKFELTTKQVNSQKLVHGIRRYQCTECLLTTLKHRRHQASTIRQKNRSLLVKSVKRTASECGVRIAEKPDADSIVSHREQRGLASLAVLRHSGKH